MSYMDRLREAEARRRERLEREQLEAQEALALLAERKRLKIFTRCRGEDLTGREHGGWKVLAFVQSTPNTPVWLIGHSCGHKRLAKGAHLRRSRPPLYCLRCGER